ncbi:MAG: PASTA domain-containing protein [Desulfovibrio sp.]|nr:PASTA domain-containing protein [Desulfovibrio sp.]
MGIFFPRRKNRDYIPRRSPKRLSRCLNLPDEPKVKKNARKDEGGESSSKIDWGKWRINFVISFFCLIWAGLWARAWYLQMVEGPRLADKARRQHMASELVSGKRGLIYDRQGNILAKSVEARSVYANPAEIGDLEKTVAVLAPILGSDETKLKKDLGNASKRFVWLKRKVDDQTAKLVKDANLTGIGFTREYDRFYPFKHMAGQLLGFVGLDDKGLEGIERALDDRLGATPVRQIVERDAMGRKFYLHEEGQTQPAGEDIRLTLDMAAQFITEEAVAKVAKEFDARWSGALVVDIKNGDILAWAQYPFFNPNTYREFTPQIFRNRLAADALEPGSTFKPLVMAAAINENKVTPNTLINCEGGKWVYKNFTIRDTSIREILPASKVMRYSSNIGMAKIGLIMGTGTMHKYLNALGFGQSLNLPIANSRGILRAPRDWGELDLMSAAFGQSISVTALQMAQAYLTLLNNGVYKPLRLVDDGDNIEEQSCRVFSERSVKQVLDMMRDVVEEKDGTGKRARLDIMEIGGKTGTAQKADQKTKTYGEKRLASFVGFFPAKDPQIFIIVLVDEPALNPFGGIVAAPAFKEIAARLASHSGMASDRKIAEKEDGKKGVRRKRGLKLAGAPEPPRLVANVAPSVAPRKAEMKFPGHLAKPAARVPDVLGKSVRNAVELFARAGIVPELKGAGPKVVRQSPAPGSPWTDTKSDYVLWLSER